MYSKSTSVKTFSMLSSPNFSDILPCSLRDVFRFIENNDNENINYIVFVLILKFIMKIYKIY